MEAIGGAGGVGIGGNDAGSGLAVTNGLQGRRRPSIEERVHDGLGPFETELAVGRIGSGVIGVAADLDDCRG
ncbi:MAG: hypothetical protein R2710_15325 [Acidimicrobiales bacterium]